MRAWLVLIALAVCSAEEPPKRPDYLSRKPIPGKTDPGKPAKPAIPPPKAGASESELPVVAEMKVDSTATGPEVSSNKPTKKKTLPVHGEVRTGAGANAKDASGTAVVQDKKSGKWAVTVSSEKVKTKP